MNILSEIKKLHGSEGWTIDRSNRNPYRILLKNDDGSATAFYFSCPIYRSSDRKLIVTEFIENGDVKTFCGINAVIRLENQSVSILSSEGYCTVHFKSNVVLEPSMNGIAVSANGSSLKFRLRTDRVCSICQNRKFFALMKGEFQPFLTVNGLVGERNEKIYPVTVTGERTGRREYLLTADSDSAEEFSFEINLYAPKMIFDTTVESGNPELNNAFGAVAFLGESDFFGEQWLYSRFDSAQLSELGDGQILDAKLFLHKFGQEESGLESYALSAAWCSFHSTWNARTPFTELLQRARLASGYEVLRVTEVVREIVRTQEQRNPGVVIKRDAGRGYAAVSTGDNYLYPQILKIDYKTRS